MFPITKKNFVFDKWVFFPVLILLIVGIFAVFSASTRIDEKYDLLFKKHFIFCLISLVMIYFFSQLSMKNLILLSISIFTVSFFLMCLTIFFFPETKGATRWIKLFNISLQPSEIIKPVFVIISSLLLSRYKSKQDYSFLVNILIFLLVSAILLTQPDFGMFLLIASVWIIQVINSDLNTKTTIKILLSFFFIILLSYIFIDHVQFRIHNFFFSDVGDNYQIKKSLESFANGGLFGKGFGYGVVSKNLPDAHSDFIFALIGEEFGFAVITIIIFSYISIYLRTFIISQKTNNFFILNSLTGLANIFIFQTIINISSSLNILPTKGMTLPFISYGGSSLISNAILISFILVLIKNIKNE